MSCIICEHPRRFRIEKAISEGTPKARVAKDFGISRTRLQDHIKQKHQEKNPAVVPAEALDDDDVVDPFPNDHTIRGMTNRAERLRFIERLIDDRRFYGSETLSKLARIWRASLGNGAADQVADLFAEALKRQTLKRGPKSIRKAFALAELLSLYRECRESGDKKTAATLFGQYIELDNLKEDRTLDRAVLVQIVQLIKHEAPHLERRVEEHLAQFEIVVDQAKAVLDGEVPPQMPLLSEPASDAPPTPRSESIGIDTGIPSSEEPSSDA